MIDAHVRTQGGHARWLYIDFALPGQPLPPGSNSHDCNILTECGPYLLMQYDNSNILLMFRIDEVGYDASRDKFTKSGVVPLVWISPAAVDRVHVNDDIRGAMLILSQKPGFLTSVMKDSDLLAKVMIAGAAVTPFAEQSPTARLFGGPGSKGYVLTLPDSSQKHVLEAGDDGMPVLHDDARVDIHRFLAR